MKEKINEEKLEEKMKESLHYLKIFQDHSSPFQPEIREAISDAVKLFEDALEAKEKEKKQKFRSQYPCGPCNDKWDNCICECGWVYDKDEVLYQPCTDDCDTCEYCGDQKCPKCNRHLHCGGCI